MFKELLYFAWIFGDLPEYADTIPANSDMEQAPSVAGIEVSPLTDDVLFIGHSLVSTTLPQMISDLVTEGGVQFQVINGAPLIWSWDHSFEAQGVDARAVLPTGDFEAVIITEGGPILSNVTWNDSNDYALRWYNLAVSRNSNARVYLYEIWPGFDVEPDPADWQARVDSDLPLFEDIADYVNATRTAGPEMLIIPGGQALARMHEEIEAGRVVGLNDIRDLFSDDIHLTEVGFYYMAMVHYATIYNRSPEGLPYQLRDEWGGNFEAPSPELAAKMQEIAWEVVNTYPRSRVAEEDRDTGH